MVTWYIVIDRVYKLQLFMELKIEKTITPSNLNKKQNFNLYFFS